MSKDKEILEGLTEKEYEHGFVTDVEQEFIPKGLNEDIIRLISAKKEEPEWMLEFRLEAFRRWQKMTLPTWAHLDIPEIDFQDIIYYAAPKRDEDRPKEIDPELEKTFDKLGIPLHERAALAGVAVDAVFDSVSVKTTFRAALEEKGIIFCAFSEAVREHPDLVRKYLASVVPVGDNFYAALNSAVFSDGSFVYIPKGVRCPMELSSYFRINAAGTGQFERTLIVADEGSYVSYMEGCTAPTYSSDSLHAAVVEIYVGKNAKCRYTTIQNWSNNVYNLVTKRAIVEENGLMEWIDGNIGSKINMKYPTCILNGSYSKGRCISIAVATKGQIQDAGARMIHLASNTTSEIISKSIASNGGDATYRGKVKIGKNATNSKSTVKCDTILFDEECNPYVVSTPERDALQLLSCDISPVVHLCAKTAFNRIKEKELKQTVSFLLKKYGMYELAISLGMDLNNSLTKKLVRQEILGLPTDKEIQKKSKKSEMMKI